MKLLLPYCYHCKILRGKQIKDRKFSPEMYEKEEYLNAEF